MSSHALLMFAALVITHMMYLACGWHSPLPILKHTQSIHICGCEVFLTLALGVMFTILTQIQHHVCSEVCLD